ncbi:hypothetical protein SMIR_40535 [Streptomyces mirabilis]|uniref:condensation domain-containing protein n=1 Tax=Streptomyces mirabilis TaxID=68239 RepID=UPI001BAEA6C7|nr:condensation domain-containing protein [Streptomyces mirabilis]QUW84598.1 hypothetical protein SMIR_40535 [Streptomyces mirabilis]
MIPLSPAQQRLWFMSGLEGPSPTYNNPVAIRLPGAVDRSALNAALRDVLARHEALRTVFPVENETPYQLVRDMEELRWELEETEVSESELPKAIETATACVFDLATDVPVRAWLFAMAPERHVLLVVVHRIAWDGWSARPFVRDVVTAYGARSAGNTPVWEPLPVRYPDHLLRQRELLGTAHDPQSPLSRQVRYWRDALAGVRRSWCCPRTGPAPPARTGGVTVCRSGHPPRCTGVWRR